MPWGLLSGSADDTMRFWDTTAGVCLRTVPRRAAVCMAVLPDGKLATGAAVTGLNVWRGDTHLVEFNPHTSFLTGLAALPNGHLASCSNDKTVCVSDPTTGHRVRTFRHDSLVAGLAVLPHGNLASGSRDRTVRVSDPLTGECITEINTGQPVGALSALPSGEIAVAFGFHYAGDVEAFVIQVWE